MNETQSLIFEKVVETALVDNGSFTVADIDAGGRGAGAVDFLIVLGGADIATTVLKVQESDDDTTYTDITDGGFTGSALPSATSDNTIWRIRVNMKGKKRHLRLVFTVGDGSTGVTATVIAILSQLQIAPTTATERGLAGEIFV